MLRLLEPSLSSQVSVVCVGLERDGERKWAALLTCQPRVGAATFPGRQLEVRVFNLLPRPGGKTWQLASQVFYSSVSTSVQLSIGDAVAAYNCHSSSLAKSTGWPTNWPRGNCVTCEAATAATPATLATLLARWSLSRIRGEERGEEKEKVEKRRSSVRGGDR